MEISYYYECFSYKANFDPKCLTLDVLIAEFSFKLPFHDDYNDILSSKSTALLKIMEPLLKKSFGAMEINLSCTKIRKGSVIIVEELRPVRNSVSEVKLLLSNNKNSCEEFLDEKNCWCWHTNTQKIFRENGYEFLGVRIIESNEQEEPTAFPTTSKMVLTTSRIMETDESITTSKSPKFLTKPVRSTQRFTMKTVSINQKTGSTVKKTDFQSISSITSTKILPTKSRKVDCQEIIGPDNDEDITTCSIPTSCANPSSSRACSILNKHGPDSYESYGMMEIEEETKN